MKKTPIVLCLLLVSVSPVLAQDVCFFRVRGSLPTSIQAIDSSGFITVNAPNPVVSAVIERTASLSSGLWYPCVTNDLAAGNNQIAVPVVEDYNWSDMSGAHMTFREGFWQSADDDVWVKAAFGISGSVLKGAVRRMLFPENVAKFLGRVSTLTSMLDVIPFAGGNPSVQNDIQLSTGGDFLSCDTSIGFEWYKAPLGIPIVPICMTYPRWSTDTIDPATGELIAIEYTQTLRIQRLEYDPVFQMDVWRDYSTVPMLNSTEAHLITVKYYVVPREPLLLPAGQFKFIWGTAEKRVHIRPNTYQIISGSFSWDQARDDAVVRGGHIATITSQAEWEEVLRQVSPPTFCWLGGTDNGSEGAWRWVTGETWGGSFNMWWSGEPNNWSNVEHWLLLDGSRGGWGWNDARGWFPYILEIEQ